MNVQDANKIRELYRVIVEFPENKIEYALRKKEIETEWGLLGGK